MAALQFFTTLLNQNYCSFADFNTKHTDLLGERLVENPPNTMEESTAQTSNPDAFVIPEDQGYAMTDIKTCEAIEFLMTKLEQVNLDDLSPDDRKCEICREEFHVSENVKFSHAPVRTTCGHIFGNQCIIKWLDPLCLYREESDNESQADSDHYGISQSSCPKCRHDYFPAPFQQPLERLRVRLWYWDSAYASAGVARSAKEERTRKYLWEYVNYCELFEPDSQEEEVFYDSEMREDTPELFREFVQSLRNPTLTPAQESRWNELEQIAAMNIWEDDRVSDADGQADYDRVSDANQQAEYEAANRRLIYTLLDARDF